MSRDLLITVYVRGNQKFIFCYDDANRVNVMRTLGRWSINPEIDFDWKDVLKVLREMRETEKVRVP